MNKIRPIFLHSSPDAGYDERYDTVMMINGTIAVLNAEAAQLGISGVAIDESYPGANCEGNERAATISLIHEQIESALRNNDEPVVFATLLSYNAEGSLEILKQLKTEYGTYLRTGVGGQLVGVHPRAYLHGIYKDSIDQVATGDAETCLAPMLLNREKVVTGSKKVTSNNHYRAPMYRDYIGLVERLNEMSRYKLGPFSGMRQLITESVRGCSWASTYKRCKFCSLKDVSTAPVFRNFREHFDIERRLAEEFGANWIFDVSNNWVPTVKPAELKGWLLEYLKARKSLGAVDINRYVYLTANAITAETAPLLREAGVRVAYIGLDGWDTVTRRALGKTTVPGEKVLEICRENDLFVRTSLVVGSGLNSQNVANLPLVVEHLMREFGGNPILSFGTFIEIVLPGSDDWYELEKWSRRESVKEISDLFRSFERKGFLTLDEQDLLNELRIRSLQKDVTYESVVAARDLSAKIVHESEALSVTLRECDQLKPGEKSS